MNLLTFYKRLAIVTLLALFYIYLQMRTYDLAYQRSAYEKQIESMKEENGYLFQKILTLKSAYHLGDTLLTKTSHMEFLDSSQVVELTIPAQDSSNSGEQSALSKTSTENVDDENSLLGLLSR